MLSHRKKDLANTIKIRKKYLFECFKSTIKHIQESTSQDSKLGSIFKQTLYVLSYIPTIKYYLVLKRQQYASKFFFQQTNRKENKVKLLLAPSCITNQYHNVPHHVHYTFN